jgi:hypothetical protein
MYLSTSSFNGVFKSAGTAKIRGFNTFSKCKLRGGGYRISHGSLLKMSIRRRLYGVTYIKLKNIAPVIRNQCGEIIQNFEVFGLLRDC